MLAVWTALLIASISAQTKPGPQSGAPAPQTPTAPAAAGAPEAQKPTEGQSEPYSYRPEGRRDPFVSLVARGIESTTTARGSIPGIGGLTTAEISVRGVLQSRGGYVAMIRGADNKTYVAHVNDRLIDGVITQINAQGLVIVQEVNDPLSLVKQREVRKSLRSVEEGK